MKLVAMQGRGCDGEIGAPISDPSTKEKGRGFSTHLTGALPAPRKETIVTPGRQSLRVPSQDGGGPGSVKDY